MQTGTAGLQNIFDIDSIESRYENGMLGIESGSRKNAYGDLEESFQLEFMAQHTPPNHEKRQVNETMNEKTSVAKDNDTGINKNPKVLKSVDSETGRLDKIQIDEKISNELKLDFESIQYFSRLFKNKVGQSPTAFRK